MFLKRDFFHVGPIREDIVLNGRGAAPIAIAVGEFSHVADLWGSHHISATKTKANLFEHLSLLPFSALSPAFFSALSLSLLPLFLLSVFCLFLIASVWLHVTTLE